MTMIAKDFFASGNSVKKLCIVSAMGILLTACANQYPTLPSATIYPSVTEAPSTYKYLVGPGDSLNIFVWGNPEISGTVDVRPDGMISTKLVEDIPVSGKTPTQVARKIEKSLAQFIRDPIVTVIPDDFLGPYSEQVRIIGEATNPKAISYSQNMTLLDAMIEVGGLAEFADGDNATLIRIIEGQQKAFNVQIDSLVKDGNIAANIDILPGDIIIIPEAWY